MDQDLSQKSSDSSENSSEAPALPWTEDDLEIPRNKINKTLRTNTTSSNASTSYRSYENDASRLLRSKVVEDDDSDHYTQQLKSRSNNSIDEETTAVIIKTIMVGSDFQAVIPEGLCQYGDALPYENEDKLQWDPEPIPIRDTEEYLRKAATMHRPVIPLGVHLRDNEPALLVLQQCGHNVDEALRRLRMNKYLYEDTMQAWSEEECRNFEAGVRLFGKNFYLIQQNKVRTRSVGELVQFYYIWKKTERHDIFANKLRLEKKKYVLHPGITDFMDRFLEEHDGNSSPIIMTSLGDESVAGAAGGGTKQGKIQK